MVAVLSEELQDKIVAKTGNRAPDLSDPDAFQKWLTGVKEEDPELFGDIAFEVDTLLADSVLKAV